MAEDIYSKYAVIFVEKYTNKNMYSILSLPEISLDGARRYTIPKEYEYRPDTISYLEYGTIDFADYIAVANKMLDPIKDFYAGNIIYLPALSELIRILAE